MHLGFAIIAYKHQELAVEDMLLACHQPSALPQPQSTKPCAVPGWAPNARKTSSVRSKHSPACAARRLNTAQHGQHDHQSMA